MFLKWNFYDGLIVKIVILQQHFQKITVYPMKNELFVTDSHLKNHCLVVIIYLMFMKYSVCTWVFLVLERDFKRDNLFEFWMFLKVCFWKQLLGNGIFGAKCKKMRSFLRKKHSFYFCGSRIFFALWYNPESGRIIPN